MFGSFSSILTEKIKAVPLAIAKVIHQIEPLVNIIVDKMQAGGRLFYIGAGTSGRLGIIDASEIPPTYGVSHGKVIGIIAGGDKAIRKAVEYAEDDSDQAWKDLEPVLNQSTRCSHWYRCVGKDPICYRRTSASKAQRCHHWMYRVQHRDCCSEACRLPS